MGLRGGGRASNRCSHGDRRTSLAPLLAQGRVAHPLSPRCARWRWCRPARRKRLRDDVESCRPAVCVDRRSAIEPLDNFVPAAADAPKWIGDGDVISSGVQGLVTAGVSSRDLVERGESLLKHLVELSGHRLPPWWSNASQWYRDARVWAASTSLGCGSRQHHGPGGGSPNPAVHELYHDGVLRARESCRPRSVRIEGTPARRAPAGGRRRPERDSTW